MGGLGLGATTLAGVANAIPVGERHPIIHDALHALRHARKYLKEGAHDFGGHREEAVLEVDKTIHQLEICLRY
jgi:hypothetical protein